MPLFRVFDLHMLRSGGLLIVGCPKWIVPDQMQLLCLLILNLCISRPSGFSTYQDNHFLYMSLIFAWTALLGFQSTETLFFA